MPTKNNIPYLTAVFILFVGLKFLFKEADNHQLAFLLAPIAAVIGLIFGVPFTLMNDGSYFSSFHHVIIDKSCSGYNLWLITMGLFAYLLLKHLKIARYKIFVIPIALFVSYIFTIGVNASRICVSIMLQGITNQLETNYQLILHEGIGVLNNLTFLIMAYLLFDKFLNYKLNHA